MKQACEPQRRKARRWFFWPSYLNSLLLIILPHTSHLPLLTKKKARNLSTTHQLLRQTIRFSVRSGTTPMYVLMGKERLYERNICKTLEGPTQGGKHLSPAFQRSSPTSLSHCIVCLIAVTCRSLVASSLKRSPSPFWLLWTFSSVSLEKSSRDSKS